MSDKTAIAWTDATVTPIRARNLETGKVGWHCEHASEGCRNCYSETQNVIARGPGTGLPFAPHFRKGVELFLDRDHLTRPLRWRKPRRIFWCSMTDLFADFVPDEWIDQCFAVFALAPQHTFQVLTKRAERARAYLSAASRPAPIAYHAAQIAYDVDGRPEGGLLQHAALMAERWTRGECWPLPNVWLGVSVEDQPNADKRVPELLQTPAAKRFVSYEPALGPVDFRNIKLADGRAIDAVTRVPGLRFDGDALDQIIVGAESGASRRSFYICWLEDVASQIEGTGCALFVKQGSDRYPGRQGAIPDALWARKEFPS